MPAIFFTVTNDLSYDQRMIRICTSLSGAGYDVTLVGRKKRNSVDLKAEKFKQVRLPCFFETGKLFYLEFNIRLFFYLLIRKMDAVCAIDLDSIIPCYYVSKIRKCTRIYDAHEYFSQQKEILSRPVIYRIWHWVEKRYVPRFTLGYTVSDHIADAFREQYGVNYAVIRNLPNLNTGNPSANVSGNKKIIIYQGAVNEARGLEYLLPAMKNIDAELHIYGDGNYMKQTRELIRVNNLEAKVFMKGKLLPEQLDVATKNAYAGINLVENTGLNQYYSLANKFFDFMNNAIPQVTMDFPEYRKVNEKFEIALLLHTPDTESITAAVNRLMNDSMLYSRLQKNCLEARNYFNWQLEENKLISFYNKHIG